MTPAEAQAEIRSIAEELLAVEDQLRRVWDGVPRAPGEDAMFEGRKAWDLATEIRTVVECVGEDLRGVVGSLERVSQGDRRSEDSLTKVGRRRACQFGRSLLYCPPSGLHEQPLRKFRPWGSAI